MFCRRSNLVQLVSSDSCPIVLKDAWNIFQKHLSLPELERGPLLSSNHKKDHQSPLIKKFSKEEVLDCDIQFQLAANFRPQPLSKAQIYFDETKATIIHSYHQNGVLYTDFHTNHAHSLIYYNEFPMRHSKSGEHLHPAQIRQIFRHVHMQPGGEIVEETYIALHTFLISDLTKKYFASFVDFRAGIFHREPSQTVKVIKASQIHCHANQRPWDEFTVVMRGIDRVSTNFC